MKPLTGMVLSLTFNTMFNPEKEYSGRVKKPEGQKGPVIDTTKESKRARRRRLAREGGGNG